MASFQFAAVIGTTISFNPDVDFLFFSGDANGYTYRHNDDGNLEVADGSGNTVTLTDFTLSHITTTNFRFSSSTSNVIAGDNTTGIIGDDTAQAASGVLDLVAAGGSNLDANNVIFGLGEGDIITVGAGNNVVYGGSGGQDTTDGSDTITVDGSSTTSGSNVFYGNAGNDTFIFTDPTGSGQTARVFGGRGNDDVVVGAAAGDLVIAGNIGNDTINGAGSTGSLTIYGGDGGASPNDTQDLITSGLGNASIYGNGDNDTLYFDDFASGASQTFNGGQGDDTLQGDVGGTGSSGNLVVNGNLGSDTIDVTTHLGNVTVRGGNGNADSTDGADTLLIGAGVAGHQAVVYANAGADTITSSASLAAGESLTVYGGAGADTFNISGARSATSAVMLYGNNGNDIFNINNTALVADTNTTFLGFEATDVINLTMPGGDATDLVVTGLGSSAVITNGAANGDYTFTSYTGNFDGTNLVLSDGSTLTTNFGAAAAALAGTANNDQIIAGQNGDTITGAAGDDILTGGDGADDISGGDGVDTIHGGEGNDTIDAGDGGVTGDSIADSVITGGTGSDLITGGMFEDSLTGGNGNDTLAGGLDVDTLTGGNESDTFEFAIAEVDATDTNVDLVTDAFTGSDTFNFSDLTVDTLRGDGTDFASGSATTAQALGANVGLYVATNAAASFSETNIYTALSGIADDFAAGDIIYVMISNGTDARLARITEAANAGTLVAADDTLEFVARLSGVSTADLGTLVAGNFDNFV